MSEFLIDRRQLFAFGGAAAVLAAAPRMVEAAPTPIVIATGGKGGVFYPYGEGLAEILSGHGSKWSATVAVTGGSVDNARMLTSRKAQLGFATVDSAYDAIQGTGAYAQDGKQDVRVAAVLYDSYLHVVASQSSGIQAIAGMKGKRVSIGSAGSSTESIADRVLEAAGLDPATDVIRSNLGAAESAAALKDGSIDAFFWIGGVPTAAVADLATAGEPSVVFLPTGNELGTIDKKYPGLYTAAVLPKSAYAGMTADIPCLGVANLLIVSAKVKDRFVTSLLRSIFGNLDAVHKIHPEAEKLTLATAAAKSAIPFHPAAEAFYRAKGVLK